MNALRELTAWLCEFIYMLIAWVYELFINISRVEILSSDEIKPIYERVTMILAIIMVFYVTFEFVKFIVQPEGITDKEKGAQKTVMKMIMVVVLIAFVPNIFTWAYKLQNTVFDNQLFSKIILGKQDVEMSKYGRDFSANLLSMFYFVDDEMNWVSESKGKDCGDLECKQVVSLNIDYLRQNGKLPYLTMGLDEKAKVTEAKTGEKVEEYKINFNGLFAVGVGLFVAYMLILYCVDAGVRVAQLTFLQIIAPIPIIGYLSPKKDGIFQKWCKQCLTTYLDLFIRVGIIYFILLICQVLGEAFTDGTIMENATNTSDIMKVFMFIAILMGLLLFAKKAPKMLQELFPSTGAAAGNFGLKPGERGLGRLLGATLGTAAGAGAGLATGVVQGMKRAKAIDGPRWKKALHGAFGGTVGAVRGTLGGTARGLYNGAKKGNPIKNTLTGTKNQIQANKRFGATQENGYGIIDKTGDTIRSVMGLDSRTEVLEKAKVKEERKQAVYETVNQTNDKIRERAKKKVKQGKGRFSGALEQAEKELENIRDDSNYATNIRKNIAGSSEYLNACQKIEKDDNYKTEDDKLNAMEELLNNMTDQQVEKNLNAAQQKVKKLTDLAVNDYITYGNQNGEKDSTIRIYQEELQNQLTTYNTNEDEDNKLSEAEINTIVDAMYNGEKLDALVGGDVVKDANGTVVADYRGMGISDKISVSKQKIVGIKSQQDAIKRQTAGSEKNKQ